jgi:hypothetical protein
MIEIIERDIKRLYHNKIDKYSIQTIQDYHKTIMFDYRQKNSKNVKYLVNKLLHLKSKNGDYLFNVKNYTQYMEVDSKYNILDIKNDLSYLNNKDKVLSNKQYSKVRYIEYYNKDKDSMFLTLTCPSKYHYFSSKGKNKNCIYNTLGESIDKSFEFQKVINRELYKNFKKELSRKGINTNFDFIKMLEKHNKDKNLTIHSHSLFYLTREQRSIFGKVYKKLKKKYNLKQTKLVKLRNVRSSNYVIKYITKNIKDNKDNFYNEVKRYNNNHKLFSSSNFKHSTQEEISKVYNYIKNERPKLYKRFKNSNIPIYVNIEKYILKNIDIKYKKYKVKQTKYINTNKSIKTILKNTNKQVKKDKTLNISLVYKNIKNNRNYNILLKNSIYEDIKKNTKYIYVKKIEYIKYKNKNKYIYKENDTYIDSSRTNIFKKQGFII